jgi:hypothetical protein
VSDPSTASLVWLKLSVFLINRVKVTTGRCEGRKPFGFYEGEPATLQRIQQLRSEGMSFDRLAEKLNAEGSTPGLVNDGTGSW